MYLFKQDTLRDGVIDAIKNDQWRLILNKYEESLIEKTIPNKQRENRLKKFQKQISLLINQKKTIYLNSPTFKFYQKKNHCLLNIWKHEKGIKTNF